MENYDPAFRSLMRKDDLLVGGFNFGTGSSREQAATALRHAGIRAVLAGSFNETYKRNALNNGLLVVEAPELVRSLQTRFGTRDRTVRTGLLGEIDVVRSVVRVRDIDSTGGEGVPAGATAGMETYDIDPIGIVAQELVQLGGLDGWVKEKKRLRD
jgi:homoaconitate hydratase